MKNVSPDGGPFGLISKKTCRRTDWVSKEDPSGRLLKNVSADGRGANDALIVRLNSLRQVRVVVPSDKFIIIG